MSRIGEGSDNVSIDWFVMLGETRNEALQRAFDAGEGVAALLGTREWIPDPLSRSSHDFAFVLRQLMLWAVDRGRLPEATALLLSTLRIAAADPNLLIQYCWSAVVVLRDEPRVPEFPWEEVAALVAPFEAEGAQLDQESQRLLTSYLRPALRPLTRGA